MAKIINRPVILVESVEDLDKLNSRCSLSYICKKCGKRIVIKYFDKRDLEGYKDFICKGCKINLSRTLKTNYSIKIENKEDLDNLTSDQQFEYNCVECGKLVKIKRYFRRRKHLYIDLKCEDCRNGYTEKRKSLNIIINIEDIESLRKLRNKQLYSFICKKCGKIVISKKEAGIGKLSIGKESTLLCQSCNMTDQNKLHPEWHEKAIETNLKNHGGVLNLQEIDFIERNKMLVKEHPEWHEKSVKTNIENHGGTHYNSTAEFKQYMRKYMKDHPEINERSLETNRKNHGGLLWTETVEGKKWFSNQLMIHKEEWTKKAIETTRKKYGVNCIFELKSIQDIAKLDRIMHPEKYGPKRYIYYGISFDSFPEFCVYLFCIYNNIAIIRDPVISFKYLDMIEEEHYTYPDFMINDRLVEIKGGQFFNDDSTWVFPYSTIKDKNTGLWRIMTPEEKKYIDDLYERKRQCLLDNNVLILRDNDPFVLQCINWVNLLFTKQFIQLFQKSNPNNFCYGVTPYNKSNSKYTDIPGIGCTPFNIYRSKDFV